MEAVYVSTSSFIVEEDKTSEFLVNRRVRLDCGDDGIKYADITESVYSDSYTTVTINEDVLTINLITAFYGVVMAGQQGNLPPHFHTEGEGDGGYIPEVIPYFKELLDTPATYSGTEGYFAKSTGSGIVFEEVQVEKSFTDLTDTATTYLGTEGYFAKSTGSGIVFEEVQVEKSFPDLTDTPTTLSGTDGFQLESDGSSLVFVEGKHVRSSLVAPSPDTVGYINDFHIKELSGNIYKKKRPYVPGAVIAKSVVFDFANNYDGAYIGITKIEFLDINLNPISLTNNFTAYATSTWSAVCDKAFLTSTPKTGGSTSSLWMSQSSSLIRLICVFDYTTNIYGIIVNNGYANYSSYIGAQDVKIYSSFDNISSVVYGEEISNSTLLYNDKLALHPDSDVVDDQVLSLDHLGEDTGWEAVLESKNNFIELNDTPVTLSGTEGLYAKSTGSGISFEEVQVTSSFLDLTDVPATYENTEGMFAKSTGSGIDFYNPSIYVLDTTPDYLTLAELGDLAVVSSVNSVIKKNRVIGSPSYVTKSCIIDIADNWGSTTYISIRQVDFYDDNDNLITLIPTTDYLAYATTDSYHADPEYAFDTSSNLINDWQDYSCWMTNTATTNTRLTCVFNTVKNITKMVINNGHDEGGMTTIGAKNIKIYLTPDTITDITYDASITNSKLVFDGQIEEHVAIKIADPQNINFVIFETDTGWDTVLETKNNFIELNDTPTTFSGTDGLYAKSTGSGIVFEEVQVEKSFLDLTDTETTYDGTVGKFAKSTGSGINFYNSPIYTALVVPDYQTPAQLGDLFINSTDNSIIEKNRNTNEGVSYLSKSVIIDITNTWGSNPAGVRSIEFYYNDVLINMPTTEFTAYSTTNYTDYYPSKAFDTTLSKIGSVGPSWYSEIASYLNQRLIIVFNAPQQYSSIVVNNLHDSGGSWNKGIKDVKIYTSSDEITSTVFEEVISNSFLIFDGQIAAHVAENVVDDQVLNLNDPQIIDTGWDTVLETKNNFIELNDTPTTFSGTDGLYAKSTGSGIVFEEVQVEKSFTDLTDTATTYLGTEGYFAKSTGSGVVFSDIIFPVPVYTLNTTPEYDYESEINDIAIDISENSIIQKNRINDASGSIYSAKSVVIDMANNWGDATQIAIRSIEFLTNTNFNEPLELIAMPTSNFTVTGSTRSSGGEYRFVFDTTLPKTGSYYNNQWQSYSNAANFSVNQRLIIVFNVVTEFKGIYINNGHNSGTNTTKGAKDVKIYISDDSVDEVASTVTVPVSNSTLIFSGQLDEHVGSDVVDDQNLTLIPLAGYVPESGWDTVLETKNNFIELDDTPAAYLGTDGKVVRSNGTGVVFDDEYLQLYTAEEDPTYVTPSSVNDFLINTITGKILEKNRDTNAEFTGYVAKSVIIDIANTTLSPTSSYMGVRSIEFYIDGALIQMPASNFTAYNKTQMETWASARYAFDTTISKTEDYLYASWMSGSNALTNQRLIIVFDTEIAFDSVVINNYHNNGGSTSLGIGDTKIYASFDSITDTTYNATIPNSTLIFDGYIEPHVSEKVIDDQVLVLAGPIDSGWDIVLETKNNLIELNDTPDTYLDTENFYLKSTGSEIVFEELNLDKSFLDLTDTETTYSGTDGFYTKSTGSGIVFEELYVEQSFLDLTDTSTTYSGTDGLYATSTGSGIVFEELPEAHLQLESTEVDPTYLTEANINDFLINSVEGKILEKTVIISPTGYTAKSVVIDIEDNWGYSIWMDIRSVEFIDGNDDIIDVDSIGFDAYATTSLSGYSPSDVFSIYTSKVGSVQYNGWRSANPAPTNQRVICVFNSPITFFKIIVNNGHQNGTSTSEGIKSTKIHTSTDEITETVYDAVIPASSLVFDGQISRHVEADVIDDQLLEFVFLDDILSGWDTVLETKNNFIELNDTPQTFSGTYGLYAKSTGSGIAFDEIQVDKSFTDLTDTPETYENTEGYFAKSTGSGIYLSGPPIYTLDGAPSYLTEGDINDFIIDSSNGKILEKTRAIVEGSYISKSVVLDLADNWGDAITMGIRSIEFYFENNLIELTTGDFVAYATTDQSLPLYAFKTSLSKVGTAINTTWYSDSNIKGPFDHRLIVVFSEEIEFDTIVVNNAHFSGTAWVTVGVKNVKIYTSIDAITSTVYGEEIPNSSLIFDGQIAQHIAEDIIDDQVLDFVVPTESGWDIVLETKNNFIELNDTPTTYSGEEGSYLRLTSSGILAFDGVIITSPNMTEWIIKVTDQGTLYTEELY